MPPHTGCCCASCYGFAEWLADHGLSTRGLPSAPGHHTEIVELDDQLRVVDRTKHDYTCPCDLCAQQRAVLARAPRRPAPQPWDTRRAA